MRTKLLALFLIPLTPCLALEPTITKLFSTRADGDALDDSFGTALAGSDRWIVAGEPGNDEKGVNVGAAYLFDAKTGILKRKLLPPGDHSNQHFGRAVAVSGNRIVIGAPAGGSSNGEAYVFDAPSGRLLGRLLHEFAGSTDLFGSAVAIAGNLVVVGAPADDGNQGSAFIFDIAGLNSFLLSAPADKLVSSPRSVGESFGSVVATDGRFIAVGVPTAGGGNGAFCRFDAMTRLQLERVNGSSGENLGRALAFAVNRLYVGAPAFDSSTGQVRVFSLINGLQVNDIENPDNSAGEEFGFALAANSARIVVGAPAETAGSTGKLHLFDLRGNNPALLEAPDGTDDDKVGASVALAGDGVIASADPGGNGILYRFNPVPTPLPDNRNTLAKLGDSAPGAGAGRFQRFHSLTLGQDDADEVLLRATAHNAVTGVWEFDSAPQAPAILNTTNLSPLPIGTLFAKSFATPMWNNTTLALLPATLRGQGQALLAYNTNANPVIFGVLLQPGRVFSVGVADQRTLASMDQIVQSTNNTNGLFSVAAKFKRGANGVTAANDSGVVILDSDAALLQAAVEGSNPVPAFTPTHGQISPRVAVNSAGILYHARLLSTAQPQAMFLLESGGLHGALVIAGNPLSLGDGIVSSIVGETAGANGSSRVARVTLRGDGITRDNNETLVHFPAAVVSILSKGESALDLPSGVVISRFLRFWGTSTGQFAAQVVLRGPGVNASNDGAFILVAEDQTKLCLLREGDTAPGCDGARIGSLQAIEIDHEGDHYSILASLANAAPGRNQALFTGRLTTPIAQLRLRKPVLNLRKGLLLQGALGGVTTLQSITLGARDADATGASGKGLPTAVNDGDTGLILTFGDRTIEAVAWSGY